MALSHYLGRIAAEKRRRGTAGLIRFLAGRLLARPLNRVVYETAAADSIPPPVWKAEEIFFFMTAKDLDRLPEPLLHFLGGASRDYLEGVRHGDFLYAVRTPAGFVHSGFVLMRTEETILLGEPHGTPLIANCITSPHFRGQGFYPRALAEVVRRLRGLGHHRLLIETDIDNLASRRGIEKCGFRLLRTLRGWILASFVACLWVETNGSGHLTCRRVR